MLSVWWIVGASCCTEKKLEGTFLSRNPSVSHRESLRWCQPLMLLVGSSLEDRMVADEIDELLSRARARRVTVHLVLWCQVLGPLCFVYFLHRALARSCSAHLVLEYWEPRWSISQAQLNVWMKVTTVCFVFDWCLLTTWTRCVLCLPGSFLLTLSLQYFGFCVWWFHFCYSCCLFVCLCLFLWISFSQSHGWCLCQCCPASAGQILTCSFVSPSWVLCQVLAGIKRCTVVGGKVGSWKLSSRAVLQAKTETKLWSIKRGRRTDLASEDQTDQILWLFVMVDLTT